MQPLSSAGLARDRRSPPSRRQVLFEDENTNRMDEAVTLFDQICNHNSFKSTSMILFLNKRDLFQEKLKKKDLTCRDPKCDAGHDYDKAIAYIKQKFLDKNSDPLVRQVYCHATCATDTSNVAFVMDSVFDVILKDNLRKMQRADLSKILDAGGVRRLPAPLPSAPRPTAGPSFSRQPSQPRLPSRSRWPHGSSAPQAPTCSAVDMRRARS